MRHLHGFGVLDDRKSQGQNARGSAQAAGEVPRIADHRYGRQPGLGQTGGLLRRARLPGARQVRHAGVAYVEICAEQRDCRAGKHGMNPGMSLKDQIIAAFKKVYDPEMPVNIYELGLIYGLDVDDAGQVAIRMTLTAPNCPVAGSLPAEVERAARGVPGVTGVKLELTFDPPCTKARTSEAAKLAMGIEDIIPIARLRTCDLCSRGDRR